MYGRAVAVAVAVAAVTSLPAAPAHADKSWVVVPSWVASPPAYGLTCGTVLLPDPTLEEGEAHTGWVWGGPMTATAIAATISMTCTVQVGAANATHAGVDSAAASSASFFQTASVPQTLVSVLKPDGQPVFLCTQVVINGVTYYWDSPPSGTGAWSTSNAANCFPAV